MTTQLLQSGGVQTTIVLPQIIYLDFDGELTRYNGEILTVDNVTVEDSGLTEERIAQITQALNDRFSGQNVEFVTEKPASGDYSTIFIGKTSSFEPYGTFAGLAETVDSGNQIRNDNAFVMLDSVSSDNHIADVIAHEAGHLLGTLDHGGEGLKKYAASYIVSSGVTSTGVVLEYASMHVSEGGTADSTTLRRSGVLYVSNGGIANHTGITDWGSAVVLEGGNITDTTITSGNLYLSGGASASDVNILSGDVTAYSGAVIQDIHLSSGGGLYISGSIQADKLVCDSGAILMLTIAEGTDIHGSFSQNPIDVTGGFMSGFSVSYGKDTFYTLTVSSGGTAVDFTDNSYLAVLSGGTATGFSMNSGALTMALSPDTRIQGVSKGVQIDISDARLSNYTVHGGALLVYSGGYAENIGICDGNYYYGGLNVYSGGSAKNISGSGTYISAKIDGGYVDTISDLGIDLSNGGYVCNAIFAKGGITVQNGIVSNTVLAGEYKNNARIALSSGGTAIDTVLKNGCAGSIYVGEGGTAFNTVLCGSGNQAEINCSGGTVISAAVDSMNFISAQGGTVDHAVLNNGGWMAAYFAETYINHTTVNSGGELIVSGALAENTTVNCGGRMRFLWGSANGVTVESGGRLVVPGSNALGITNLVAKSGAEIYVELRTGTKLSVSGTSGGSEFIVSTHVSSGSSGGSKFVVSHQMLNVKSINSGCNIVLYTGGYAEDMAVDNGGQLDLIYGDVYNINVNSGGTMRLYDLFEGLGVLERGRNVNVNSGGSFYVGMGSAYDLQINSGGIINFGSGGHSEDIHAAEGAVLLMPVASYTYVQGTSNGSAFEMKDALLSAYTAGNSGGIIVYDSAKALDIIIESTASARISNGGVCEDLTVQSGGTLIVSGGGSATDLKMEEGTLLNLTVAYGTVVSGTSGGTAFVVSDYKLSDFYIGSGVLNLSGAAKVVNTGVCSGGKIIISGGSCSSATIDAGGVIQLTTSHAHCISAIVNSGGSIEIQSGYVDYAAVNNGGEIRIDNGSVDSTEVYSGGKIFMNEHCALGYNISAHAGAVVAGFTLTEDHEFKYISSGIHERLDNAVVCSGASAFVDWSGIACNTRIESGGCLKVNTASGSVCGKLDIADGGKVIVTKGTPIEFSVHSQSAKDTALISNWSLIEGGADAVYTIVLDTEQESGTYVLASGAADFANTVSVRNTGNQSFGTISAGGTVRAKNQTCTLVQEGGSLKLLVSTVPPENLAGDSSGISWKGFAESYVAEYTLDDYAHSIQISTSKTAVNTFGMPGGEYGWKVRNSDSENWVPGTDITAVEAESPQKYTSAENDIGDLFFASGSGVWESGYAAQHVGCGSWSGTGEQVDLAGKNRITDVFEGSADANILVMTDDANGDALFVDDIYSAFPDEQQARIAQIDEIRAGAGDDIVDMTSQLFVYTGDGVTIRGGDGNDVIWANSGDNKLFGDAGNDRIVGASGNDVLVGGSGNDSMHGGGGDDIFCFCQGWGTDTVEQLSGGSVTLWFVSGMDDCWDQETMTYTLGKNSVHVTGVTQVTLKFGDDGSELYDTLLADGAFMAESSEKIWEESGKGVLAKL